MFTKGFFQNTQHNFPTLIEQMVRGMNSTKMMQIARQLPTLKQLNMEHSNGSKRRANNLVVSGNEGVPKCDPLIFFPLAWG